MKAFLRRSSRHLAALPRIVTLNTFASISALELARFASTSASVTLRPYQQECVQSCLNALSNGMHRIGVSLPTGSGKTTIFADLIPKIPQRGEHGKQVLVLVGTVELARQASDRIKDMHPHLTVQVEQGSSNVATGLADCTIATYQTLLSANRIDKFVPEHFKCIFVDEAHHAASNAYLRILSRFDDRIQPALVDDKPEEESGDLVQDVDAALESAPAVVLPPATPQEEKDRIAIMGFSATFSRHDGLALSSVFDHIVFHMDFIDMITQGWLIPVRFTTVKMHFNFDEASVSRATGDFVPRALSQVVNTPKGNDKIFESWKENAADRKATLVFAVDVAHVESLVETFKKNGVEAKGLTGKTHSKTRMSILNDFKTGVFPVLINCAILTEGADVPLIDCVLLARPTLSKNLFSQMIGRGLRLSPDTGKKDCLIIDLVGNTDKGLICAPSLFGLDPATPVHDATVDQLKAAAQNASEKAQVSFDADRSPLSYKHHSVEDLLQGHNTRIGRLSSNAWVPCGGNVYVLELLRLGYIRVTLDEDGRWLSKFYRPLSFAPGKVAKPVPVYQEDGDDDFSRCVRTCDTAAARLLTGSALNPRMLLRSASWRRDAATPAQSKALQRMIGADSLARLLAMAGVPNQDDERPTFETLTKGQASALFTLTKHGGRGRLEKAEKAVSRAHRQASQAKKKRSRMSPVVSVGPLQDH